MAIVTLNVSAQVYEDVKKLVERGLYANAEQFAEIACLNQLALERAVTPDELLERGHRGRSSPSAAIETVASNDSATRSERSETSPEKKSIRRKPKKHRERPRLLKRSLAPEPRLAPKQAAETEIAESLETVLSRLHQPFEAERLPVPLEPTVRQPNEYVLSLVNRLFNLKIIVRATAVRAASSGQWPKLTELARRTALDAAVIGAELQRQDDEADRRRNLLSSGLPRPDHQQSIDRFMTQYIGRKTKAGDVVPGALTQFSLGEIRGDRVQLTSAGVRLAKLTNPILDGASEEWQSLMSLDEQRFFVHVIASFMRGESRAGRAIVDAIGAGNDGPEPLVAAVRSALPSEWTDVMVRGHISGAVARLSDAGVVTREWSGRTVKYRLNESLASELGTTGSTEVTQWS